MTNLFIVVEAELYACVCERKGWFKASDNFLAYLTLSLFLIALFFFGKQH